ncbi:methyltransferase domain-containing protein [Nocardiopsis dassonvillei]|uniref:methyltransferase domain-containing protein n=1 Tax=Nocardiopsis dassonvillei TaxID=2014 RepID=UPI00157CD120|nr:methyltransferase domain-containing protein [Nocardiopsis dassonvillei]
MRGPGRTVDLLRERHAAIEEPVEFELLGRRWHALPGVYAPHLTTSAALYSAWVPFPVNGAFCEVGCGTGYLSVLAALSGCATVTATDISPEAAENTRMNAREHGVENRVHVYCGDMFEAVPEGVLHDVVFWNSNFLSAAPEGGLKNGFDRSLFDPEYASHRVFMQNAERVLAPSGRLLLGFTDLGDADLLESVAADCGWRTVPLRRHLGRYPEGSVLFELRELVRL